MMPLVFSVSQHEALQVAHRGMQDGEHLMAFLDDVYMAFDPDHVGPVYATVQDSLWEEAGIRIHVGKTKVWNAAGIRLAICGPGTESSGPSVAGCRIPVEQQGIKILGTHSATQRTSRGS